MDHNSETPDVLSNASIPYCIAIRALHLAILMVTLKLCNECTSSCFLNYSSANNNTHSSQSRPALSIWDADRSVYVLSVPPLHFDSHISILASSSSSKLACNFFHSISFCFWIKGHHSFMIVHIKYVLFTRCRFAVMIGNCRV